MLICLRMKETTINTVLLKFKSACMSSTVAKLCNPCNLSNTCFYSLGSDDGKVVKINTNLLNTFFISEYLISREIQFNLFTTNPITII